MITNLDTLAARNGGRMSLEQLKWLHDNGYIRAERQEPFVLEEAWAITQHSEILSVFDTWFTQAYLVKKNEGIFFTSISVMYKFFKEGE